MNYEQKYKEALERARDMMSYKEVRREDMEYLFPELKESTDEGIRESIAGFLKTISSLKDGQTVSNEDFDTKVILEWVAWLEKQGEQKSVEDSLTLEEFENAFITKAEQYDIDLPNRSWDIYALCKELYSLKHKPKQGEKNPAEWHIEDEQNLNACLGYIPDEFLRRWLKDVIHTKYDKSVDKVEPRFKVGDFIVNDYCRGKVVELTNDAYLLDTGQGIPFSCERNIHLWDITKDAKDGDMLCTYECGKPKVVFILKGTPKPKKHCALSYHCYYNIMYPYFSGSEKGCLVSNNEDVKPATKEQHELLLQKMKETGYEWDVEKKELKKIEQTIEIPFGTKDSELQEVTYHIPYGYHAEINGNVVVIKKGK